MKNIFVTGGAGYIGSHVVGQLAHSGYNVIIYDNLSEGHKQAIHKKATFVKGDLSDKKKIDSVFKKYKVDAVMHFAASCLVGESMEKFEFYFHNNVTNSLNLLEAMRSNDIKKIVFSSSAAVYGEPENIPIEEGNLKKPTNPYGFTKKSFEDILMWYDQLYSVKSISLRYFNAAGAHGSGEIGEDHGKETHLIPLVLKAAFNNSEIKVFGTDYPTKDGTCIRDYIHVLDLADAHIRALEALDSGTNAYNLGSEKGYSVREIIEVSKKITGKDIKVVETPRRPGDPAVLVASSKKIKKELGWKQKHSDIKTIIKDAWEWHRKHPEGYVK